MSVWPLIHNFWGWAVGGFAALATLADAVKGFKWSKSLLGMWASKMFGLAAFKVEISEKFEETNKALAQNHLLMQLIAKEMKPNGGSSLRDVVNKIEERVDQIDVRQILNSERVKAVSTDAAVGIQEFNAEGELIWCNRTYLRMLSRDLTEMLGYGWLNSVHPQDRDNVKEDWIASIQKGMAYESEYRVLHPNGEVIHISVRATVMRSNSKILGYITTVSQIK